MSAGDEQGAPSGWHVMGGRDDPFHALNGPFYMADAFAATDEEPARFGFRVGAHNCSYSGFAHGGWIGAVLDVALGKSVQIGAGVGHAPTVSLAIDFLRAGTVGDWLESRVRLLRVTRSLAFCDGVLIGPEGVVARASGTFKLPANRPPPADPSVSAVS